MAPTARRCSIRALALGAAMGMVCAAMLPPTVFGQEAAAIERDSLGNLALRSTAGQAVIINEVDVVGMIVSMQDRLDKAEKRIAEQDLVITALTGGGAKRDGALDLLASADQTTVKALAKTDKSITEIIEDVRVISEVVATLQEAPTDVCKEYPVMRGGTVHGHGRTKGAVRVLGCNTGLTLTNSSGTTVCRADGTWSNGMRAVCVAPPTTTTKTTSTTTTTTTQRLPWDKARTVENRDMPKIADYWHAAHTVNNWKGANLYPGHSGCTDSNIHGYMGKWKTPGKVCMTKCQGGFSILGGPGCIGKGSSLQRHYMVNFAHTESMKQHTWLKIEIEIVLTDTWDKADKVTVLADHEIIGSVAVTDAPTTTGGAALCGVRVLNGKRFVDKKKTVTKVIRHTADSVTITVMSDMNGCPGDESWGIRRVVILAV